MRYSKFILLGCILAPTTIVMAKQIKPTENKTVFIVDDAPKFESPVMQIAMVYKYDAPISLNNWTEIEINPDFIQVENGEICTLATTVKSVAASDNSPPAIIR